MADQESSSLTRLADDQGIGYANLVEVMKTLRDGVTDQCLSARLRLDADEPGGGVDQ
jgi:hypothetical protein